MFYYNKIPSNWLKKIKVMIAATFAGFGIAFPLLIASGVFNNNTNGSSNFPRNQESKVYRPIVDLYFGGRQLVYKDLKYKVSSEQIIYHVTKIRREDRPSAWISQSCIDGFEGEKFLSRPFPPKKKGPRLWKPSDVKYRVVVNNYTAGPVVISNSKIVQFDSR